jgi:lipopolysaccharide transport system ATP-binding protein
VEAGRVVQDWVEAAARLAVTDGDFYGTGRLYPAGWDGKAVLVDHRWEP